MPTVERPPRFTLIFAACLLGLLPLVVGCGQSKSTTPDAVTDADVQDTSLGFETKSFLDVPIVQEDLGGQTDAAEVAPDTGPPTDVVSAAVQTQPAVNLGATVALTLVVNRNTGVNGAPSAAEVVTFTVNGQPVATGATLAATPQDQWPVAIFATVTAGQYQIAGVRPGTANIVALVDGIASPATSVVVSWPDAAFIGGATAKVAGSAPATRVDEVAPDTVKMTAQVFTPGGVDATVRIPSVAAAGDSFAIETAPATGSLSISLSIVDPAGQSDPETPKIGRLWVDQTDKGYLRGTFLGNTLDQTPVVGAFAVERDGNFGVDLLDDAQLVEKSDSVTPAPIVHASRVSVNAIGNGQVLLTWRRIKSVTQAEIARWIIDAKTGATITTLAPLVQGNVGPNAQNADPVNYPTFGGVSAAVSNSQTLIAWEGKNGFDSFSVPPVPAPSGIWMRHMASDGTLDATGVFAGNVAVAVTDDACQGACAVQLLPLPSARFLVLWSPPTGGIRARRVEGDFTFTDNLPLQVANPPLIFANAAVLDALLGIAWIDPTSGAYMRVFTVIPSAISSTASPETAIGVKTLSGPAPAVGIFAGGAPGFLAFALDGSPAINLKMRRIDTTGSPVVGEIPVETGIDLIRVVSGKTPQVTVVQHEADPTDPLPLRVRKFTTTSPIDGGTQLGPTVDLGAKSSLPLLPSVCYVPEVDIYVVAWSGDYQSEGVYFQRFR